MKRPITFPAGLPLCVMLFCFSLPLFSQTSVLVGIPNGANGPTEYPTPYGDVRESMRAQYLYRASELENAGAPAGGLIFAVGFIVSDPNGSGQLDNFTIRISHTAVDDLNPLVWEPAGTLVYDTTTWVPQAGGNLHLLETPFLWDGFSNLLVEICHTPTNASAGVFQSFNASVQWTTGLPFNASRTFAADDFPAVCGVIDTTQSGARTNRPVLALRFSCLPPVDLSVVQVTSVSATLQWNAPFGNSPAYQYEIGAPGFTPGNGNALFMDTTSQTTVTLDSLNDQTNYEVYVRSDCGNGQYSNWVGPVMFTTAPGCGDSFFDSGGPQGNYGNAENTFTTICPANDTTVVTLSFTIFDLAGGDTLRIYNGTAANDPLWGEYISGNAPPPLTATTASGCLSIAFVSDTAGTAAGWSAKITCDLPDSCFQVAGLNLFNLSATTANFSWSAMFGAQSYAYRLETLDGQIIVEDATALTQLSLNGLTPGTAYRFLIRTDCGNAQTAWITIPFNTPLDCNNAPALGCQFGTSGPVTASGTGIYNVTDCGSTTPGRERIFRYTAPNTRNYRLKVLSTSNSNIYVSYFYKEVALGCGPDNWNCIGSFNTIEDAVFGELTAGKTYYILFDPESTAPVTQFFQITDCTPVNDEAWTAIDLNVDEPCPGYIYANNNATYNEALGEPNPDPDPADGYVGRWLTEADGTVWFSFEAPSSGSVIISTESIPQGSNFDTQLALYEAGDPFDYSTFELIVSDDDNGGVGLGFNSFFPYTGLTPGQTYFVQVDGFSFVEGTFCIEIIEGVTRIAQAECDIVYSVAPVDGTQPGGDRWYNVFSMPDVLDLGDLVLAVKPGQQNLDTFFCKTVISDTIPITPFGVAYLPMYFQVSWSNTAATLPVEIRLFFLDDEFSALQLAANAPSATIDDLNVSYYNGINQDCYQNNNDYPPAPSPVTVVTNVTANNLSTSPYFMLDLNIPGPGEIGAHLGLIPLPMQLRSFTGSILEHSNRLEWVTESERDLLWHIVERSPDGLHWSETTRTPGALASTTTLQYRYDDENPLPQAYYRLRSIETDGEEIISHVIYLNRGLSQARINIYPTPADDQLMVDIQTDIASDAQVIVNDLQGSMVLEQTLELEKGFNSRSIPVGSLPSGMYTLIVRSNNFQHLPVRFIKN